MLLIDMDRADQLFKRVIENGSKGFYPVRCRPKTVIKDLSILIEE